MGIFSFLGKKQINIYPIYSSIDKITTDTTFTSLSTNTSDGQFNSYVKAPIINMVVDKLARLASNAKFFIEDKNGFEIQHDFKNILKSPNSYQNYSEFIENYLINLKVFGEVFIMPIKMAGLKNVRGLTILPNQNLTVEMDYSGYPFLKSKSNFIKDIKFHLDSQSYISLNEFKESIIIITDNQNPNLPGRGFSKLISLNDHINKYLIACNANRYLLENYGGLGMWINQGKDAIGTSFITPEEKKEIQEAISQHGITSGKKLHYISSQKLKFEKISLPISELMLPDTINDSVRTICDTLGYNYELLSNDKSASLSESGGKNAEAKRQILFETIIPAMSKLSEALQRVYLSDSQQITFYYDHLPFMQQNEQQRAELFNKYTTTYIQLFDKGLISKELLTEKLTNLEIL